MADYPAPDPTRRRVNETPGELIGITVADLAEAESLRKLVNFVEGA